VWPLLARLALRYKTSADYLLGLTDNPAPLGTMNTRPADPLFASRTNTRLDRTNLRHMLNTVARQAKVSNVHPHRFRHTFAITFLRNGGNTFALQKLLGHSELSTVLKYVRLAETDIRQAQAAASVVDNWRL
jgi:integrase/recombinase XerD